MYCKAYEISKPTYVCQHVATDWLAGEVLWTEEMSTHDRLFIFWTCVEPSLWGLNTFFYCNTSRFQIDPYVVDICLFLGFLQLHQISLKDDTSLVSEYNIVACRCLSEVVLHCVNNGYAIDSHMFISNMKIQSSAFCTSFCSHETNYSLIPFVSQFVVSGKKKEENA